jgi:hypothetical protein
MSKLRQSNGDDHPDAAGKHLLDAEALEQAQRYDGAAYHAGYVVECAMKSLILAEQKSATTQHGLAVLGTEAIRLAALPNSRTAKYAQPLPRGHQMYTGRLKWMPMMRYRSPGAIGAPEARAFISEASRVYKATVAVMKLDGVA